MKTVNRMEWILAQAKNQLDVDALTAREMFDLQEMLTEEFKPRMAEVTLKVLEKHGKTRAWWDEVLSKSNHWRFAPTEEEDEVNRQVIKALKEAGLLCPNPLYSWNMFSGQLSSLFGKNRPKNCKVLREKANGVYVYFLEKEATKDYTSADNLIGLFGLDKE